MGSRSGVLVESGEKSSPAAEAGSKPGDLITALDGVEMRRSLDLQRALLDRKPGEQIEVVVSRSGGSAAKRLSLGSQPEVQKSPSGPIWEALGLELKPVPPEEFRSAHQTRYSGGLKITAVRPNSPAAGQGIRSGDVLVGMHIWETVSLENVTYILNRPDFASFNPVTFYILRAEKTWFVNVPVGTVKTAQR